MLPNNVCSSYVNMSEYTDGVFHLPSTNYIVVEHRTCTDFNNEFIVIVWDLYRKEDDILCRMDTEQIMLLFFVMLLLYVFDVYFIRITLDPLFTLHWIFY